MSRSRLRELGLGVGSLPVGPQNSIADVNGVSVGHATRIGDDPAAVRTGVTIVQARPPGERLDRCYAAIESFNGNGEFTGSHWIRESGLLDGPIGITNTHQAGLVRDTLVAHTVTTDPATEWCLPVVGETFDGFLNDIDTFPLTADDVRLAVAAADRGGPVIEGNVGGGTGMICHGFKGGIGSSSRTVETGSGAFTVGVLVQANYGERSQLRLDGRAVGLQIGPDEVPIPWEPESDTGSIIVIVATDAPLLADQCARLARRATVGLARTGSYGANGSGDLFLAFSTANRVPRYAAEPLLVRTLPPEQLSPLFQGVVEAVEEAIWNGLCAAETMTGKLDRTVHAIPLDLLRAGG